MCVDLRTFFTCEGCIHHSSVDTEQCHHHEDPLDFIITTLTSFLPHLLSPYLTSSNHCCVSKILSFQKFYVSGAININLLRLTFFSLSNLDFTNLEFIQAIISSPSLLIYFIYTYIHTYIFIIYTTVDLTTHLLKGILAISSFWLLQIKLL